MSTFTWEVFLPGEDLPRELQTDYLLAEGDVVDVAGRWLVESVEIDEDLQPPEDATAVVGVVRVARLDEPA